MYRVIINLESPYPYEVWTLDLEDETTIFDGEFVNGFQILEDAISNAEMLNIKER